MSIPRYAATYPAYGAALAPAITSFTPNSGAAGTTITVTGTNLSTATAAKVGATAGTITGTPTATSLTFTAGAGSTTGVVSVTTPSGTATSSGSFTVIEPLNVVADGNSITYGYNSTDPWPTQLQRNVGSSYAFVQNVAESGIETQGSLDKVASTVDSKYDASTYAYNLYFLEVGVNDILHKIQPDTFTQQDIDNAKANIQSLHVGRAALGFKCFASTILKVNNNDAPFTSALEEISQYIRDHYVSWGCVGLCDYRADSRLQNPTDTAVFADGLHPTALGDSYMQNIAHHAMNAYLATVNYPLVTPVGDGTGTGAPVAPTFSFDPTTRLLTISHPLGDSEILRNVGGAGYGAYSGPIQIDANQHPAGYVLAYTKAAGSRPAGDVGSSPSISSATMMPVVFNDLVGFTASGNNLLPPSPAGGATAHSTKATSGGAGSVFFKGYAGDCAPGLNYDAAASTSYDDIPLSVYLTNNTYRLQNSLSDGSGFHPLAQTDLLELGYETVQVNNAPVGQCFAKLNNVEIFRGPYAYANMNHQFDIWNNSPLTEVKNVFLSATAFVTA